MSSGEINTEQPLRRERRTAQQPFRLAAEHLYLMLAAGALAAFVVLILVDHFADVWVARGVYSMLAAWFVIAGCGLVVRLEAARNRRLTCAEMAELRKQVTQRRQRAIAECGCPLCGDGGKVYAAQGTTVRLTPPGLDSETQSALQRITGRLSVVREDRQQ